MNPRVLDLLKNPKHIQSEDLDLLKKEISSFPYVQNIRALHLYGVHVFDKENYQKELSTTAAYTTDKKILYQLINGKIEQKPKSKQEPPKPTEQKQVENIEEKSDTEKPFEARNAFNYIYQKSSFPLKRDDKPDEVIDTIKIPADNVEVSAIVHDGTFENNDIAVTEDHEQTTEIRAEDLTAQPEIKHVYVNGERNRILFEGEENFLDDETTEIIDVESTLESGVIVTQKIEKQIDNPPLIEEEKTDLTELEEENSEEIIDSISETVIDDEVEFETQNEENLVHVEEEVSEDVVEEVITSNENEAKETTEFTPETIINEDEIASESEQKTVDDDSELSFHGTESFLPEVKIQSGIAEEEKTETPSSNKNKHEDEMRRLIEEVERKMKESKVASPESKNQETEEIISHDISFAETQSFEVKPQEIQEDKTIEPENNSEVETLTETKEETQIEIQPETIEEASEMESVWKPMSFESHTPDSLIKKEDISKADIQIEETPTTAVSESQDIASEPENIQQESVTEDEIVGENEKVAETENTNKEAPAMNVSFFGSDISSWKPNEDVKNEEPEMEEVKEAPQEVQNTPILDSNIPGFINTWQSWLKIDRVDDEIAEPEPKKDDVKTKEKTIETFIENNPRISQLKDESSYVIKERNDDISHLMTETLANLYIEQKLYTKATKAFQILINKFPEKKEYFESKIQEIKDIRNKN